MAVTALDTTVLYAAADESDRRHDDGLAIVKGVNEGTLPNGAVVDYVLAETMNGVVRNVSHGAAVDYLDRIERNDRFEVGRLGTEAFATGKAVFRKHDRLSLVDGLVVGYMRDRGLEYVYSFDAGFDGIDGITRLPTADNPYAPG